MAKRFRIAASIIAVAAVGCAAFVVSARAGWLTRDEATVQQKHRAPNSRFITVEGVNIHYLDEGSGPAVLLLHGSYLDVHVYDNWAKELSQNHRVVRLDRPAFGLTGHDPAPSAGYEREAQVIAAFAEKLGVKDALLVGASSGGTTAARLAARYPHLVSRLVLINFPLARKHIKPDPVYALSIWTRDKLLLNYQPTWLTRWMLHQNLTDDSAATPAVLERLTDKANRPGALDARRKLEAGANTYSQEEREADLRSIKAPALLIWGRDNPLLTVESGQEAFAKVGSTQKKMAIIDNGSHMIPVEKADESLKLVRDFLASVETP